MSVLQESAVTRLATVLISAKTVAITTLYVVPAGKRLIVDHVTIRCSSFTAGGKSIQAVASFGGNSATYDDYLNSVTYTFSVYNTVIRDSVEDAAFPTYYDGEIFKISVETGSDATTENWSVSLFGHLA